MTNVIGVRFRTAGKIYYFDPGDFTLKIGNHVICETARGVEYGTVCLGPKMIDEKQLNTPLKTIMRPASKKDDERHKSNLLKKESAYKVCLEKIANRELPMKLIDAEYTFDNNKVLFYFTAEGRIDFRELVKDLAAVFRTRIELRQVGLRDEAKILGSIGNCGRAICCHTYLPEFARVSIKMAREQNMSLNPNILSGICGRLMCCLEYENDTYQYLNSKLPNIGDVVITPDNNKGEVMNVNVLKQKVKVKVDVGDEKELIEYSVDDLKFKTKHKKEKLDINDDELKKLEALEKDEEKSRLDDD